MIIKVEAKAPDIKSESPVSQPLKSDSPKLLNSPIDQILSLQQAYGNYVVQRMFKSGALQAKLKIGKPGDKYEREADRVAKQIMTMKEPGIHRGQDEEETIQTKPLASQITPLAQRQADPEEEKKKEEELLQTKGLTTGTLEVMPDLSTSITSMKGGGQPLSEGTRAVMERRFGQDFSQVRVHTDNRAADASRGLNAQAFTVGSDISFGAGKYAPETKHGTKLLAHELTHVVQQQSRKNNNGTNLYSVQQPYLQRAVSEKPQPVSEEVKKAYPPINWTIDHVKKRVMVIPKPGVSLEDIAVFLYGSPSAMAEIAAASGIDPAAPLTPGLPLQLTGKKLTPAASADLNASPKIPLGVTDPEAFLAKKKTLDKALDKDFNLIVNKLDESHYSDSDELQVISILRKWGEEKFTTNPQLYPYGGEYLDELFSKLTRKRKDVGIIATQWTNYYSLIFNHFDRVREVMAIRDIYSRRFRGDSGLQEMSFGSYFWEQVKEGKVRDQIFAYFRGLGKGIWSGAKGTVMMAYTLVTDPKKFLSDLANLPGALRTMWEKRGELWKKFANASPEEQAEMIGEVFGEIEFMIASSAAGAGAAKGVEKLTQVPGKLGKIAKATQVVTKLPKTAMGAVAKGAKIVVLKGGRVAVEGAILAAKGIYRVGGKILRGTWSVVEKVVEKITKKIYYFYDDVTKKLREIPAKFAKECVQCTKCKLLPSAKIKGEEIWGELAEELGAPISKRRKEALKVTSKGGEEAGEYVTSTRLKRGLLGEKLATEALASKGHKILDWKPDIMGTNQPGIDIVTFKDGFLHLVDNKALTRAGNVSSVSALTTNFSKNLQTVRQGFTRALQSPAISAEQRAILTRALKAIELKKIKKAVTNANVAPDSKVLKGVTDRLKGRDIEFINVFE